MSKLLEMKNIYKVYPNGVVANKYVNFDLNHGEIHALAGENGAGKSTLMKILFGMEQQTEGNLILNSQEIVLNSSIDAINHEIGMVHQHFMLVPSLSIAENIMLGMEPTKQGFIDKKLAIETTKELALKYNFDINPNQKVEDASVGTKQKVEILKALYRGAKLLILDEPTAVLTPQETEELFSELVNLKEQGHTIVFISHKLNEIKAICDRITIMRKGESVGVYNVNDITTEDISNLMVGSEVNWDLDKSDYKPGKTLLSVKDIVKINDHERAVINNVSFSIKSKEILGVVGVEGNGQLELAEGLAGYNPFDSGSVILDGKEISKQSISNIREAKLSYIPSDRMSVGIAKDLSIKENIVSTFARLPKFSKNSILNDKYINEWSEEKIVDFNVVANSIHTNIGSLSGGNIQKVVVAREFSADAKLIIADQPTRGIDVGAAKFIHNKLLKLRDEGAAVLLISADLKELLDLSDNLIVMYEGKIVAYFKASDRVSEQELGLYMLGLKTMSDDEIRKCLNA